MSWETVAGVVGGVLLVYAVLLFLLWGYARRHPETVAMKDALRLLPDLLRLLRRLLADKPWAPVCGYGSPCSWCTCSRRSISCRISCP